MGVTEESGWWLVVLETMVLETLFYVELDSCIVMELLFLCICFEFIVSLGGVHCFAKFLLFLVKSLRNLGVLGRLSIDLVLPAGSSLVPVL